MTAYAVTVKAPSIFSIEKKLGGSIKLDATCVTALGLVSTNDDINLVLDFLSALVERAHAVDVDSIGKATSVQASTGPTNIALSASALAASTAGDVTPVTIGTLAGVAPIATSYVYTLVSGTGSTNNALFSISGDSLRYIGAGESAGSRSVRVRATNLAGQYFEKAITITVS